MLHITNSKIAQNNFDRYEKYNEPKYRGNPMGITEQCEGCGATYDQLHGELYPCEFCHKSFCPSCLGPHESEHMQDED